VTNPVTSQHPHPNTGVTGKDAGILARSIENSHDFPLTPPHAAQRRAEAAAGGLVHSSTSDTAAPFRLDPDVYRLGQMAKAVRTSARLIQWECLASNVRFKSAMITTTYADGQPWEARDITGLLKNIRTYLARREIPFRYVWVMELTQAGRPHYHVLLWLPKGLTIPKPDKRGWWRKGSTRIEWARSAVGYMSKYASKMQTTRAADQSCASSFPFGARIHGRGGLGLIAAMELRWWLAPCWARAKFPASNLDLRRAEGGGYVSRVTGELAISPYLVFRNHAGVWLVPRTIPPEASGSRAAA